MTLNDDQKAFVEQVAALWAKGLTQEQVATEMGRSLGAVRGRLRYYGYRFGRTGVLVPIHAPELEPKSEAA